METPTHKQIWSHVRGSLTSTDYQDARERMFDERIVRDMAVGLRRVPTAQLVHMDSGAPTFDFMMTANKEYARRGGEAAHIGCVAEALIALRKADIDSINTDEEVV